MRGSMQCQTSSGGGWLGTRLIYLGRETAARRVHEQNALLYLLFWAYSVCILLFYCFSSAAHYVAFGPFLLRLRGHFEYTMVSYRRPPKLHFKNTMVSTTTYIETVGCEIETAKKYTCIFNFSQSDYCYSNELTVWWCTRATYTYTFWYAKHLYFIVSEPDRLL